MPPGRRAGPADQPPGDPTLEEPRTNIGLCYVMQAARVFSFLPGGEFWSRDCQEVEVKVPRIDFNARLVAASDQRGWTARGPWAASRACYRRRDCRGGADIPPLRNWCGTSGGSRTWRRWSTQARRCAWCICVAVVREPPETGLLDRHASHPERRSDLRPYQSTYVPQALRAGMIRVPMSALTAAREPRSTGGRGPTEASSISRVSGSQGLVTSTSPTRQ